MTNSLDKKERDNICLHFLILTLFIIKDGENITSSTEANHLTSENSSDITPDPKGVVEDNQTENTKLLADNSNTRKHFPIDYFTCIWRSKG